MKKNKKRTGARAPGSVRVVVRCRPMLAHERGTTSDRLFLDSNSITVNDTVGEARQFKFDSVLPPEADQADSFAEVAPLVDHVLDGFHATVFAYGQTGSGKTYTMEGFQYKSVTSSHVDGTTSKGSAPDPISTPVDQHGIMMRMIQLVFDRARERQGDNDNNEHGATDPVAAAAPAVASPTSDNAGDGDGVQYAFRCSYYQIYNERITDLLRSASPGSRRTSLTTTQTGRARHSLGDRGVDDELQVRWYRGDVFKVENLYLYECDTPDKMREALVSGVRQKVMGSHLMNAQSSRSHCVFTIHVERRSTASQQLLSRSELSLVDLAGSEKLKQLASDPSAELVRESIEINASLLALGKVIMALSSRPAGKRGPADGHVPYRDSKLTKLLKHALGGNSVTVMFACITPSDKYVEESVSTLLYAGRAKNIENVPRVNEDPTTVLIRQLREEIQQLKKELAYYRTMATGSLAQQEQAVRDGATPRGGSTDGEGAGASASKAGQLADSLLAACDMLQKVMSVNGQLRDAFEVVKQDKQAAEQREVQLNAENLALRERIEMLESIALNPELYAKDGQRTASLGGRDGRGGAASPGRSSGRADSTSDDDDDDEEEDVAHDEDDRRTGHSSQGRAINVTPSPPPSHQGAEQARKPRRKPRTAADSAVAPWDTTSPLPPPPAAATAWTVDATSAALPVTAQSAPWDLSRDERASSQRTLRRPIRAPSPEFDTQSEPPASGRSGGPPPPTTRRDTATPLTNPDEPKAAPADKDTKKTKKTKNKKKQTKKVLVQKLKQYEKRYREPSHVETYAEYYDKARANVPENQQHTAALRDMDETLRKLPRDMVLSVVPLSLRKAGSFGMLSFGGSREETHAYDEKRQQREDRREQLLRKQKELHATLRQDVAHVHELEQEEMSATTASASAARSVYGSDPPPVRAGSSSESKSKSSGGKRGGTMPSLPNTATAASSSLSSVDRLRAYLDRDRERNQQQPH